MKETRHSLGTRMLHMGVALAIMWQLGVSLVMQGPGQNSFGDALFQTHQWVGIASLTLLVLFWLNLALRSSGSAPGALFPGASRARRAALAQDAAQHGRSLLRFRLPQFSDVSPLASAVHGLGLLLMTLMAGTGFVWWLIGPSGLGGTILEVHKLFANLAWVYLIAHAGLAVVHHVRREASLSEMWSLRAGKQGD
ncbi:MAG: hypothetical protein FD150_2061 [Rhodobacteraceae bacterium]|nr:MAG: hypothetical protein FD150_2061 [Paracoccaceae bacterium]